MTDNRYAQIEQAAQTNGLMIYGAFHPKDAQLNHGTLILLGTGPAFWAHFQTTTEWQDKQPDPVDRWSQRVVSNIAGRYSATPYFPFGGPPHRPFVAWALASGRAFTSPSQFLVHDSVGLMISYRGALHFDDEIDIPRPSLDRSPCFSCTTQNCINSCPAHAMVDEGPYQVAACHNHLETHEGNECLSQGCIARRTCPLSSGAQRDPAQSAHHMRYFHAP